MKVSKDNFTDKETIQMKTMMRVIAVAILVTMVLSLVACSSFGGIKANFEKHGYVYVEDTDSES